MPTVMLVHGMFLNPRSWQLWKEFFERRGYDCVAPAWPMHDGDPDDLRSRVPAGFGALSLDDVVSHMQGIASEHEDLILVGHSSGGLVVQKLISLGIGKLGVAMCSTPATGLDLSESPALQSLDRTSRYLQMDVDAFQQGFGHTMHRLDVEAAWHRFVTPGSPRVLEDCLRAQLDIDTAAPHVPLLFVAASEDRMVPARLCERNAAAYTDQGSRTDYVEFTDRGHFIQGQTHWQEVACYIDGWIRDVDAVARRMSPRRTIERPRASVF
jgi:pimeloyl-ACP methyl ester carboxylesterase